MVKGFSHELHVANSISKYIEENFQKQVTDQLDSNILQKSTRKAVENTV